MSYKNDLKDEIRNFTFSNGQRIDGFNIATVAPPTSNIITVTLRSGGEVKIECENSAKAFSDYEKYQDLDKRWSDYLHKEDIVIDQVNNDLDEFMM